MFRMLEQQFEDSSSKIIDTSTPETLERDFYAWLHASDGFSCSSSKNLIDLSSLPIPQIEYEAVEQVQSNSLPSLDLVVFGSTREFALTEGEDGYGTDEGGVETTTYLDSSVTSSPNSLSSTSSHFTNSPTEDDAASRSSGRNQLGRTYSPGLPLSMKEREYIVSLFQGGWKICDISRRLCVTHSCVSKILNRYRQTGSVKPKEAKEGRTESPLVAAIRDYRTRLGMSRQSEIREQLIVDGICTRETAPSRSSINHILRTKLDVKKKREKR